MVLLNDIVEILDLQNIDGPKPAMEYQGFCRKFLILLAMWLCSDAVIQRVPQIAEKRIVALSEIGSFGSYEQLRYHPVLPMPRQKI